MTEANVRLFDPRRTSEADSKLAAAVFERLACALSPAAATTLQLERMRRVVRSSPAMRLHRRI